MDFFLSWRISFAISFQLGTIVQWCTVTLREDVSTSSVVSLGGSITLEDEVATLGYTFDIERIIKTYLVLMGSRLRNDILVLFIELFYSAYKSTISKYFSSGLSKFDILLPSICCLQNKNKKSFLHSLPFFLIFLCLCARGRKYFTENKMPVFS